MPWHKKILNEKKKEAVSLATAFLAFSLVFSVWHFVLGKSFVWVSIDPISIPTIPSRLFYSALTFFTSGRILKRIGFYKVLHDVVVKTFGAWSLYKDIKKVVWVILMVFTYWILPKIVHTLNAVTSFVYNILTFILYLAPALGVAIITFVVCLLLLKRKSAVDPIVVSASTTTSENPPEAI